MRLPLLTITMLEKHYQSNQGIIKALQGISLSIYQGEILGLLGVNGAGKTTLSSIIATLHPASSGTIAYKGISIYNDINAYRMHIGYCPQKPNLNNLLTVRQNLQRTGAYYGLSNKIISERINKLAHAYNLEKYLDEYPNILSGGYRQRVMIARALIHKPAIIILDEPTVGLDPHIRHALWENIRQLKEENVTVILTTHYLDEAEILSDRICILDRGLIKVIDSPANLKTRHAQKNLESVFLKIMNEETI